MIGANESELELIEADWLPSINPDEVAANNEVYSRISTFRMVIAGKVIECRPSATSLVGDRGQDIPIVVGSWQVNIRLSEPTVDRLLASYCKPAEAKRLGTLQRRILLAMALEGVFCSVENALGEQVQMGGISSSAHHLKIGLALTDGIFEGRTELWLPIEAVSAFAPLWTDFVGSPSSWPEVIPFQVRRCVGTQALTWAELSRLAPGDIIMCEMTAHAGPFAIIAENLRARLHRDGALATGWHAIPNDWNQDMERSDEKLVGHASDAAKLEDLPVRLTFEVGRAEMPFCEVRELREGIVLPVAADVEGPVDIVANGRRIGRGALLRVGSGLGVRIVQLVPHD